MPYFIPLKTDDIHVQRGLFFPWKVGISKRLVIPDLDKYTSNLPKNQIPIMENFTLNLDKVNHMAICVSPYLPVKIRATSSS